MRLLFDWVCRCLLEAGAAVYLQEDTNGVPWACWTGTAAMAQIMLDAGADCNAVTHGGWTPLHAAVSGGHGEVVSCLLKAGAAVDRPSDDDATPLFIATSKGYSDIALMLIEGGGRIFKGWPRAMSYP